MMNQSDFTFINSRWFHFCIIVCICNYNRFCTKIYFILPCQSFSDSHHTGSEWNIFLT